MPLTHGERQQLEQLERQISREDPELAYKLRTGLVEDSIKTGPLNVVLLLTGILVLLLGVATQLIAVGIVGFLLMGAGAYRMSNKPKAAAPAGRG